MSTQLLLQHILPFLVTPFLNSTPCSKSFSETYTPFYSRNALFPCDAIFYFCSRKSSSEMYTTFCSSTCPLSLGRHFLFLFQQIILREIHYILLYILPVFSGHFLFIFYSLSFSERYPFPLSCAPFLYGAASSYSSFFEWRHFALPSMSLIILQSYQRDNFFHRCVSHSLIFWHFL